MQRDQKLLFGSIQVIKHLLDKLQHRWSRPRLALEEIMTQVWFIFIKIFCYNQSLIGSERKLLVYFNYIFYQHNLWKVPCRRYLKLAIGQDMNSFGR